MSVDQQQLGESYWVILFGDVAGYEWRRAQSFQLSGDLRVTDVEVKLYALLNSPTGNWTFRIETDNAGLPSGTLAHANATKTVTPPTFYSVCKATFDTLFPLSGATTYWLVIQCDNQADNNGWYLMGTTPSNYASGVEAYSLDGVWGVQADLDLYFKIYVSDGLNYDRTATVVIGQKVTASRTIDVHYTSSIAMGMIIESARALKGSLYIITSTIKYGMTVTGSAGKRAFGYVLKRYAKFGSKLRSVRFIE